MDRHKDIAVLKRRFREYKSYMGMGTLAPKTRGRFRKQHPFDCGNPRCMLCHREKLSSTPSTNDSRLGFAFEDMIDELFATSESTIVQSVNFSSAPRHPNGRKGSTGGYRRSKVQGSLR
ncbi:MAG: hypothetical protein IAF58_19525, partial [Leptolyngbya sp.]|nr:hypothetical protein [Candidatus Melainabacteria bacterium]